METLKTKNGFNVQATNPNPDIYPEIHFRAKNKSLEKYPILFIYGNGNLKAAKFFSSPKDKVKIE